jgi:hypothetical protein
MPESAFHAVRAAETLRTPALHTAFTTGRALALVALQWGGGGDDDDVRGVAGGAEVWGGSGVALERPDGIPVD